MKAINLTAAEFLSAFYSPEDTVCLRVFSDRKNEEPDYKGNKYSEKLKDIDTVLPILKQHNERHRGIFFVVNGGGHNDGDITCINSQFVENDTLPFDEQMARLEKFPLPPSIIVKTKKSLHAYWLMKNSETSRFREIQLRLVKQFDGDPMCQNESRVMRLPGFLHCKAEPVMVECIKFDATLRYTQDELAEYLPNIELPAVGSADRSDIEGVVGTGQRILDKCAFCRYCKDNAAKLSEPQWYAMVTNIAPARDGAALVHEISKPYPKYKQAETDEKIRHALSENKPHTCSYIQKTLGFGGCSDCKVKAPVVHCVLTMAEQVDELLDSEFDSDAVFEANTLRLMAYAREHDPAAYGKYKLNLKSKGISLRDFDKAVKHYANPRVLPVVEDTAMPLVLTGIDLGSAAQPANWDVSMDGGIRKMIYTGAGSILATVCPSPVVISKRFENVDTGSEKVEVSFYRNHRWKRFTAARSSVFNKSSLIAYADSGLPVSSANSADLVTYLLDYENTNIKSIPLLRSTERLGWLSDTAFFPYTSDADVCFETDFKETDEIYKNLIERGSFDRWMEKATKVRQNSFGRFMMAASFASVLLEPLNHRVFFVNLWHDSKSGKTAVIKLAASAWGNPLKIMGSFNATAVGMERCADTLRHIMYGLDERQLVNEKRLSIGQIVYGLANGFGRIRGSKEGGIQDVTSWRNIILSSGEEPLISEDTHDGINTRVLELHGQPIMDEEFGKEVHIISEKNYGFAGRRFVEYLCKRLKADKNSVQKDYDRILAELKNYVPHAKHLENAAVVCLGDYYADMCLWHEDEGTALKSALAMGAAALENNKAHEQEDIILRAWQHIQDWCVANDHAFGSEATVRYGLKEDTGTYYILKFAFDEALQKRNYPVEKCKTGFFERGYMQLWNGERQKQKKVNGVKNRYYVVTVSSGTVDMEPLGEEQSTKEN